MCACRWQRALRQLRKRRWQNVVRVTGIQKQDTPSIARPYRGQTARVTPEIIEGRDDFHLTLAINKAAQIATAHVGYSLSKAKGRVGLWRYHHCPLAVDIAAFPACHLNRCEGFGKAPNGCDLRGNRFPIGRTRGLEPPQPAARLRGVWSIGPAQAACKTARPKPCPY